MKPQLLKLNLPVLFQSQTSMNNKGFTLIESTVATVILIIGMFAVMQFFPLSLEITGNSNNRTVATNLSQSKIEEIRSLSYDSIGTGTIETKQRISSDPTSYLYNYQRETIVELVDADFDTSETDVGIKKIIVTTYWQSPITKDEKTFSINSIVAKF